MYPSTAKYLNKVTKQIDVDVLDNIGNKLDIKGLEMDVEIIIPRMRYKDPNAVTIPGKRVLDFYS